jgi:hypothetical protein
LERERDEQELCAGLARQFIDAFDDALRDGTARQFLQEPFEAISSARR